MKNNASLKEIGDILENARSVVIFPHINIDGDALGSAVALCIAMRKEGKEAWVLMEEEIPHYIDFLDSSCCTCDGDCIKEPDVCICVDCSEEKRFKGRAAVYRRGKTKLCIDHHATGEGFGDYYYIDSGEAATAQLIYKLFMEMNWDIGKIEAVHLYVGIVTDTGCFQYSNTTAETHRIAAELFSAGIPHMDVMVRLYQNVSRRRVSIQSEILKTMEFFADGRLAMAYVTEDMLKKVSADIDDTEGVIDTLRNIEGVEFAAFLNEKDGFIKVSLRAKSYGDVAGVAVKFGGGGHMKAAGCTIDAPMEKAVDMLKSEMLKSLEENNNGETL